jgi:hypothetical protein
MAGLLQPDAVTSASENKKLYYIELLHCKNTYRYFRKTKKIIELLFALNYGVTSLFET